MRRANCLLLSAIMFSFIVKSACSYYHTVSLSYFENVISIVQNQGKIKRIHIVQVLNLPKAPYMPSVCTKGMKACWGKL